MVLGAVLTHLLLLQQRAHPALRHLRGTQEEFSRPVKCLGKPLIGSDIYLICIYLHHSAVSDSILMTG